MQEVTCITQAVYNNKLTRGKRYTPIAINEAKAQIRILGDDKRHRWYPIYCFDFENKPLAFMESYKIDDPQLMLDPWKAYTEVRLNSQQANYVGASSSPLQPLPQELIGFQAPKSLFTIKTTISLLPTNLRPI